MMMKRTVPTMGMKLRGRYMKYLIIAEGVNLAKGFFASLPRRAMESEPPEVMERPSFTISVWFLEMRVYLVSL